MEFTLCYDPELEKLGIGIVKVPLPFRLIQSNRSGIFLDVHIWEGDWALTSVEASHKQLQPVIRTTHVKHVVLVMIFR